MRGQQAQYKEEKQDKIINYAGFKTSIKGFCCHFE